MTQIGYCMRCAVKRTMVKPVTKRTKNGRKIAAGTCSVCHGKIMAFLPGSPSAKLKTVRGMKKKPMR